MGTWPDWVGAVYTAIVGAALGSFANVCVWRVPRGKSIAWPRSRCPGCGMAIPWHQNIPLASYLALGGSCAGCGGRISLRYPLVEAAMAGLFLWVFFREPTGAGIVVGASLSFVLVVVSLIDWDWRIIPDVFSLGLFGAGLAASPLNPRLGDAGLERAAASLLGAAAGFSSAWLMAWAGRRVFRKEALGGGDVKLLAGLGALLGWRGVFATWFLASVIGSAVFLALKLRRKVDWGGYLPFGPFLAAGAWGYWAWPGLWALWWGL